MIATKQIQGKINADKKRNGNRYVYRGVTMDNDIRYEIYDDIVDQRTYHIELRD